MASPKPPPAPGDAIKRLPPLRTASDNAANHVAEHAANHATKQQARDLKDAAIRQVASIGAMREAIRRNARSLPSIDAIPRYKKLDAAAFREKAAAGLPFLIDGIVKRWPLTGMSPDILREQYRDLPVRARVGDYVNTAFAVDRAMADMTMGEYLDLVDRDATALPPYIGNLGLQELNRHCHWPAYFDKMGPPRFWIGPARTVTPLHCDFDDNIFAQIWGTKRIFLCPPHHAEFLYVREASSLLFGSPVDPEAPDFAQFPLARQASMIEVIVEPGDMLYVPAGWYHQVRALTFSLSSNRWARAMPLALTGQAL